jgi:hypothetical protein
MEDNVHLKEITFVAHAPHLILVIIAILRRNHSKMKFFINLTDQFLFFIFENVKCF